MVFETWAGMAIKVEKLDGEWMGLPGPPSPSNPSRLKVLLVVISHLREEEGDSGTSFVITKVYASRRMAPLLASFGKLAGKFTKGAFRLEYHFASTQPAGLICHSDIVKCFPLKQSCLYLIKPIKQISRWSALIMTKMAGPECLRPDG